MDYKKINLKNVISYIVGNLRYFLYYSFLSFLIRKHIKEQIDYRITMMEKDCYLKGYCVKCGCSTTALQMANKVCDGSCYPPIMGRKKWKSYYKDFNTVKIGKYYWSRTLLFDTLNYCTELILKDVDEKVSSIVHKKQLGKVMKIDDSPILIENRNHYINTLIINTIK